MRFVLLWKTANSRWGIHAQTDDLDEIKRVERGFARHIQTRIVDTEQQ